MNNDHLFEVNALSLILIPVSILSLCLSLFIGLIWYTIITPIGFIVTITGHSNAKWYRKIHPITYDIPQTRTKAIRYGIIDVR